MVNKKGFIRTLEAVIAIVLILGFIFYITPKVVEFEEKVPEDVVNTKEFILNQILFNKEYSNCIMGAEIGASSNEHGNCESALEKCGKKEDIMNLFSKYIPYGYNWWCEICDETKKTCTSLGEDALKKSIYTNTIFIYKSGNTYNIMRIYIWKK